VQVPSKKPCILIHKYFIAKKLFGLIFVDIIIDKNFPINGIVAEAYTSVYIDSRSFCLTCQKLLSKGYMDGYGYLHQVITVHDLLVIYITPGKLIDCGFQF